MIDFNRTDDGDLILETNNNGFISIKEEDFLDMFKSFDYNIIIKQNNYNGKWKDIIDKLYIKS